LTVSKNEKNEKFFIMGTVLGQIKKTEIEKYDNIRKTGIIAIGLKDKDELKWVKTSNGSDIIVEVSEKGQAICYDEQDVRPMGRSASGVTGMKLRGNDKVMAMDMVSGELWPTETSKKLKVEPDMLVVLENGFGKRTFLRHFHIQKRGGMGIRAASCTPRTGNVIGMHIIYSELGDVVLASRKGQFIRMEIKNIKKLGRDTQGVTLMRLKETDKVSSVAVIIPDETNTVTDDQSQITFDDEAQLETKVAPKAPVKKEIVAEPAEKKPAPKAPAKAPVEKVAPAKEDKAEDEIKANLHVKYYDSHISETEEKE
jgi:DNA gyrase subunit A